MNNLCVRPSLWLVGCLAAVALAGCDDSGGSSAGLPDAAVDIGAVGDAATDAVAGSDSTGVSDSTATDSASGTDSVATTDAAGSDGTTGSDAADSGPNNWQACTAAQDCVTVEIGCCDHCNGGEAYPVHKDYAKDAQKALYPATCAGTNCTEKGCSPATATCHAGKCVLVDSTLDCKPVDAAVLCVRGTPTKDGESIAQGDPIQVEVRPGGCWSSSCTQAVKASCQITPGNVTTFVAAEFCLKDTSQQGGGCTADCGGGGFATCSNGTWYKGSWPVTMNGLKVTVEVPSVLPQGGLCVGSQW
jgi:hypothetical protein